MKYRLIRSKRKTVSVSVKNGIPEVRAPYGVPETELAAFLEKHKNWIEKQITKQEELKREMASEPVLSTEEIRELADKALKVIPERVKLYASKIGVTYGRITIRNQRTKWGSCTSKGNLNFNCLLMLVPEEAMDSVIVHELCHRKQMNHSDRFYAEILKVFPEYYKWDKWLKDNGDRIMRRMTG